MVMHQVVLYIWFVVDPTYGTSSVVEIQNAGILTVDLNLVPWPCSHPAIPLNPPPIRAGRGYSLPCSPSGT